MPHQRAGTIRDAFDLFLLDAQSRDLVANTLHTYRLELAPFLQWCEDCNLELLGEIAPVHLRKFLCGPHQWPTAYARSFGTIRLRPYYTS